MSSLSVKVADMGSVFWMYLTVIIKSQQCAPSWALQ